MRCRHMVALLAQYLPLFLDSAGTPLRNAWLMLYPRLVGDNMLIQCAPLIDWFRVALIAHPFVNSEVEPILNATTQRQQQALAQSWHFMTSPSATAPLIQHCRMLLKDDLPSLFATPPTAIGPPPTAPGLTDGTNKALQSMAAALLRSSEMQLAHHA